MAERQTAFLIVFIKENPEKILRGNMKGGKEGGVFTTASD